MKTVLSANVVERPRPRLAVFASGEGQTLQALIDAAHNHILHADIVLVVSNKSQSGAANRARQMGIEYQHVSEITHPDAQCRDEALVATLQQHAIDIVVLAGYLKPLGVQTIRTYAGRIINTHPSLLPRHGGVGMYGQRVHAQVIATQESVTGASVHFVTEHYDAGPVIAQVEVEVAPADTAASLEEKVKRAEQAQLIEILNALRTRPLVDPLALMAPSPHRIQLAGQRHLAALLAIFMHTHHDSTPLDRAELALAVWQGRVPALLDGNDRPLAAAVISPSNEDAGMRIEVLAAAPADGDKTHQLRSLLSYLLRYGAWVGFEAARLQTRDPLLVQLVRELEFVEENLNSHATLARANEVHCFIKAL